MSEYKDLQDMVEIITTSIEIHGREEDFFRRSATASTNPIAKSLFLEIADDLAKYREQMESRRRKLLGALRDLQTVGQTAKIREKAKKGTQVIEAGLARDPVCGMKVDEAQCPYVSTYQGKQYRFCSLDCKKAFDLVPEKYME